MNHIPIHKLSEYIDGILDAREKDEINVHLASCQECRKNVDQLNKMIAMLSAMNTISLPKPFAVNTLSAIKKKNSRRRNLRSIAGSLTAAAAVLFAVITFLPDSTIHQNFSDQLANRAKQSFNFDCIIPTNMDLDTAEMMVRQNNSRILDYTNSYIIVESDVDGFSSIRKFIENYENYRTMHFLNIGTTLIPHNGRQITNLSHADKKKYIIRLQLK